MSKADKLRYGLAHFTGTGTYYRHGLSGYTYTDGAQFVAETADAYWLLDVILSHQSDPAVRAVPLQVWTLTVTPENQAYVRCNDRDGNPVTGQRIGYTDFPLVELTMWLENRVLHLPSEH